MQVKKFLALLLSAALALAVLAGCGRAVYSSQAVSAANKAQTSVDFTTSTELDNALRKAVQAGDDMTVIRNALLEERRPSVFFSSELCAHYFTYMSRENGAHFVLFDDAGSIRKKLLTAQGLGIRQAVLSYPQTADLLGALLSQLTAGR